jgi:hypothetical protein
MSKRKVIIGLGFLFLLMGILLGGSILVRFIPILGGDSVLPNTIFIASKFTLWDYLRLFLGAGFSFSGLLILLTGIALILKEK